MVDLPIREPIEMTISGEVVATGVDYEDFLREYDGQHVEGINGVVIRMSPTTSEHNFITNFLVRLFECFLELTRDGRVLTDPMIMRLETSERGRAPDVQVLLPNKLHLIRKLEVACAADLVVEVVSEDSQHRDRIEKLTEYERGGVPEYWTVDPLRRESLFNVLNASGLYKLHSPDASGVYHSTILKGLSLPSDIFWRDPLPGYIETLRLVKSMLKQD